MKIFQPVSHHLHAPALYLADGTVRPVPERPERVERIRSALAAMPGVQFREPTAIDPLPAIHRIHAPDYLHYLQTIHALWIAEFGPEGAQDVLPDTFVRRMPGMKRPQKPSAQAGFYCFDMAAPITAGTWQVVTEAAACALAAAGEIPAGAAAAYALTRPPGHHAGPDYCGGFCYLNYAAIAAQFLRDAGLARVAILDIDYHHGNGTQDIFYHRSDVLYVSLHAEPDTQYPYFWGHADETGAGNGAGFNLNLPLPRGTPEARWLDTLDTALAAVRHFAPTAAVISLGVDAYEKDIVGDFAVSLAGFREAGRRIAGLRIPSVFIQEGGYNLEAIGDCVLQVLTGFENGLT